MVTASKAMGYKEICNLTCHHVRNFIHASPRDITENRWNNGSIYTEKNKVIKSELIFPSSEIGEKLQDSVICGELRGAIVSKQWRAERKL